MELCSAFRLTIEKVGLDNYSTAQFLNMVKDFHPLKQSEIFLWRAFVREKVLDEMLNIESNTKSVQDYCLRLSYKTGFNTAQIEVLLKGFWKGILMSFYGHFPELNQSLSIKDIYRLNRSRWMERQNAVSSGLVLVRQDLRYGWYDCNGNEIIPCKYRGATNFKEGLACVNDEPNYFGFINILGNPEIDLRQHCIKEQENPVTCVGPYNSGISVCDAVNKKEGYLNQEGKFTGSEYEQDRVRWDVSENPFVVRKNDLYGLMNHDCELIVEPQFIEIDEFRPGQNYIAAKRSDGEWVIVTRNGIVYKNDYSLLNLRRISNGLFVGIFQYGHKVEYCIFNEGFKRVENLSIINYFESYSLPLLVLDKSGKYFYINHNGICCDKSGYDSAFKFVGEYTWVKKDFSWMRIDRNGVPYFETNDFEVLSEEFDGKVVIRNLKNNTICLYDCKTGESEVIVNSVKGVNIKRQEDYKKTRIIYSIYQNNESYILFYDGRVFRSKSIIKRITSNRNEFAYIAQESGHFRILFNKQLIEAFTPKISSDRVTNIIVSNSDELHILVKTNEGEVYLFSINEQKYSNNYVGFDGLCAKRGSLVLKHQNKKVLLDSDYNEVFSADNIVVTANENYLRFCQNGKWGLIKNNGQIILPPNFESIRCQRNECV